MSEFTENELEYLAQQRLGRIATVGRLGQPHVVPTSFRTRQRGCGVGRWQSHQRTV